MEPWVTTTEIDTAMLDVERLPNGMACPPSIHDQTPQYAVVYVPFNTGYVMLTITEQGNVTGSFHHNA